MRAALNAWVVLPYVIAGLVAWRRRPDSRFGVLMIAAGFAMFLSSLSTGNSPVLYTIGILFDLLPAVLFLHVFLAFPSGRLERRAERVLVGAAYAVALGLHLVAMMLGGFGPDNLLEVSRAARGLGAGATGRAHRPQCVRSARDRRPRRRAAEARDGRCAAR